MGRKIADYIIAKFDQTGPRHRKSESGRLIDETAGGPSGRPFCSLDELF